MSWELFRRLGVDAGAQYQYLGIYHQTVGGMVVELDLTKSVLVTLGMSYSF